jgi:hypothetical protein
MPQEHKALVLQRAFEVYFDYSKIRHTLISKNPDLFRPLICKNTVMIILSIMLGAQNQIK